MSLAPFALWPRALLFGLLAVLLGACGPIAAPPAGDPAQPAVVSHRPPTSLLLRLGERRVYLIDGDPAVPTESFPIAIGRAGRETPTGRFQVEEKIEHPSFERIDPADRTRILETIPPGPRNPLGERWIGFAHGEGWTVGMHGTPRPDLLGRAVSNGCVRMRNADVIRVYDRVQIGTPVVVEP